MYSQVYRPNTGGIQTHVAKLSHALVRAGHEIRVVTCRLNNDLRLHETVDDLEIVRVPFLHIPKLQTLSYLINLSRVLKNTVRDWKPDVVHFHSFWPELRVVPPVGIQSRLVHTAHESLFLKMAADPNAQVKLQRAYKHIRAVIGPSRELMEVASRYVQTGRPAVYIPNGVDASEFQSRDRQIQRQRLGIDPDTIMILCPRRLVPKNGLRYTIEAMPQVLRRHPESILVICGSGPEESELRLLASGVGVTERVIFAGDVPNREMPAWLSAADIVVFPSLMEATSIAALEAMACSVAVVATDVGGLPEIITNEETGLLVPPRNPVELANAVSRLSDDPQLRQSLGIAARHRVLSSFTWDGIAQETVKVYRRVCMHQAKSPA
ncbi:MAG: glycosyltransferase family 4 protein [Bacteroidota bacterium]